MVMSFFRKPEEGGLKHIDAQVQGMINDARHTFDLAMNALTGGPVATVADEVRRTDRRINITEMEIRRELVVHASVHGGVDTPEVLVFMHMVKDLERIGDYNKNIFDLADEGVSLAEAPDLGRLLGYRDELSSRIALMGELLITQHEDGARAYITRGDELRREFDDRINELECLRVREAPWGVLSGSPAAPTRNPSPGVGPAFRYPAAKLDLQRSG